MRLRLLLLFVSLAAAWVAGPATRASAPQFYPDDPLAADPETQDAANVEPWDLNDQYDFIENTFLKPGDQTDTRAVNVNTADEVPDSSWYTNRLGLRPFSVDDIVRGPMAEKGPEGPWVVTGGKSEGISPGLRLKDSQGVTYFIKFDPPANPQMATGAEVISTRFFHALGYHVPENYLAVLQPETLTVDPKARMDGPDGKPRPVNQDDLDRVFSKAARNPDGSYRVVASKGLEGTDLGPFRYYGTRPDDPNDIFLHEHRRELRGLRVFAAWLNHDDSRSINTRDFLVQRDGRSVVWHYLLDFGSTLGSGSTQAQRPRAGNEYIWEARPTFVSMLTLGFYVRPWLKVEYPRIPAVGRIEADFFQPDRWKPEYPNPAFDNIRPDDAFWAARRLAEMGDDAIRAVVETARYADPKATDYLTQVLIRRRDKILAVWLNGVLPVVDPALSRSGLLTFRNIAVEKGAATAPAEYRIRWMRFDNATGAATDAGAEQVLTGPEAEAPRAVLASEYVLAELRASHPDYAGWSTPVRIYFRRQAGEWTTVGLERQ
jgi:hypothetical protein